MIKNSKILLVISVIMALVLLALFASSIWIIREKNQESSELLYEVDRRAEVETLVQEVDRAELDASNELATLENLSLSSTKLVPLIDSIEGVGQSLGLDVKIESVDRVEDKQSGGPAVFRIITGATGSWRANYSYLHALESLPTRTMVESVSLSLSEDGWQSRIILSVHSFD